MVDPTLNCHPKSTLRSRSSEAGIRGHRIGDVRSKSAGCLEGSTKVHSLQADTLTPFHLPVYLVYRAFPDPCIYD
jgi:hypothetical protein